MVRIINSFKSSCKHCNGKTKVETDQGIVACDTCFAEDPNFVPFFQETERSKVHEDREEDNEETEGTED